jgi:hypothetical protein
MAQEVDVGEANGKVIYIDSKGKEYTSTEVPLVSTVKYKKPDISETKDLTEDERDVVEFSLKNEHLLIMKNFRPLKNDYVNNYSRGTVEFAGQENNGANYSFHKVVIPDGSVIKDSNFIQRVPGTDVIKGKNLIFEDCNLVNVKVDPSWTLIQSNNTYVKKEYLSEENLGEGKTKVNFLFKIDFDHDGVYEKELPDEEVVENLDDYNQLMLKLAN